jgi:hypothetical protein
MKLMSGCQMIGLIGGTLAILFLAPSVSVGGSKVHKYRYSEIDMPVSLAVGTVRVQTGDIPDRLNRAHS